MKPVVAIVGRPNVGKSTLFNRLTRTHLAIVEDYPGVTRDRLYQDAEWNNQTFTLIDTGGIEVSSEDTILSRVRKQAQVAMEEADVIVFMCDIKAGVTTEEIDQWVYDETTKRGAIPAPLNFEGFPKSVCTSINEVVCHGIPDPERVLQDGDIINVDCSTILDGYYSDSSRMFCIGNVSPEKKRLVEITRQSIEADLFAWTLVIILVSAVFEQMVLFLISRLCPQRGETTHETADL